MKNLFLLLCFLVVSLSVSSQSETQLLENFSQIKVSGSINVYLYEGEPKAEITMIKGDRDELEVVNKGKTLHLKFKDRNNWSNKRKTKINLYVESLDAINVSAGAEVTSEFTLISSDFYADASSGGSISIALEATALDADVSSGARIDIEGTSQELNVDVSSGGSYNGKRFAVRDVDANVSSGGSIKVWATEKLEADASSGGSIKYKGDPSDVNIDSGKWSGGSIRKI